MANLQIKNIHDELYAEIKHLAAAEHRSVAQQMLFLVREYLSRRDHLLKTTTSAQVLLELAGSWDDAEDADRIIAEIKDRRRNSVKLRAGF
jgi:hypothetical protein